jgi:hypothetical protein
VIRRSVLLLVMGAAVIAAPAAHAGPVRGQLWRHFACERVRPSARPRPASAPATESEPIARASARPHLEAVDGELHPLPIAEPVPPRGPEAPLASRDPASDPLPHNDHRCVGIPRGRAALVAKVRRLAEDPHAKIDHDMIKDAALLGITEVVPHLRAIVARRPEAKDAGTYLEIESTLLRATAATALADLDDQAAAPLLIAYLREIETRNVGFAYRDTLDALARVAPKEAGGYITDVMARLFEPSPGRLGERAYDLYPRAGLGGRAVLPVLTRATSGPEDVPMSASHNRCLLMAARLEAGDEKLAREVRKSARGSYSGTWLATCDSLWLGALLGKDVDDADIVLRHLGRPDLGMDRGIARIAYDRLVRMVALLARAEASLPSEPRARAAELARIRAARAALVKGLRERMSWPHINEPRHVNYAPKLRAAHFAALSALGDAEATAKLFAIIDDPSDRSGAPPWAAAYAVELDLPRAREHAYALIARWPTFSEDSYEGGRERLVDDLATPNADPAWTAALVAADAGTRARALFHFARTKPAGACAVVTRLAAVTRDEAAEDAYWSLSILGDACRADAERVARNAALPAAVKGMGLELSAMMRGPFVPGLAAAVEDSPTQGGDAFYRAFVQRARIIQTNDP